MKTVNVIEAVFFAALEKREAGERAAYLDKACNGDPDLRRCVEKLLAAQPRVGEFLQAPAPGVPAGAKAATVDHPADERPGTILGPYKLLHEIGEGGMGTVWMAEQTAPVKRRVALKVIKPGMDSKQILARFEAERQALALMDHPNIAKVLDAGATSGGRPYFVMELVKGQPITEFCDKSRLTTHERLDLFISVCNAIQHAHQKGVIHRDIKPSNVLVALYDGKPVPIVIDFGVAKAMAEPLTTKTLFTRHGQVVGTFEYMSPEQATLDQIDIDTRSDVYALGVLLYELLTGTTPLDKDELRQGGLAEVLRRIREQEPPKPSTRLTSSPGLLATAAAYRKTDSQKLPRAVRGELDWIVMKALDKDRNRRFPTANGLAADVERFLKGEPVQACPPTLTYRFRKWAGKNRVAFAIGGAVAATLLVGLALTSWQAVRATNAEHATAAERDKTNAALDDAVRIGKELDARLVDIQAANEKIHRDQQELSASRYAGDMQMLPLAWEAGNVLAARSMLDRQELELRGFEWHYWNRQMHAERATSELEPPADGSSVRSSGPLGRNDYFFSGDGTRLFRFGTRTRINLQDDAGPISLVVWEASTGKQLLTRSIEPDKFEDGATSRTAATYHSVSHDGKRICVGGAIMVRTGAPDPDRPPGTQVRSRVWFRVLDLERDQVLFDSRKLSSEKLNARTGIGQISADGRRLVVRESEEASKGRSKIYDLDAPDKEPVTLEDMNVTYFSPDGSRVIASPLNRATKGSKVFDAATGAELCSVNIDVGVVFSPNGEMLAAVTLVGDPETGKTRVLKVFDAANGKEISSTPFTGVYKGQFPRGVPGVPLAAIFSPDSAVVCVGHGLRPAATRAGFLASDFVQWYLVDPRRGEILASVEDPDYQTWGGGSPFGARSNPRGFSGDSKQFILVSDNVIRTFDVASGQPVHTLRGHVTAIMAVSASPDGKSLRSVEAGTIKEWDIRPPKAKLVGALDGDPRSMGRASREYAVSADGAWVAALSPRAKGEPDTVHVWDVAGKGTTTFQAGPREFPDGPSVSNALLLSANGTRVALSRDMTRSLRMAPKADADRPVPPHDVTVWDVPNNKELCRIEVPKTCDRDGPRIVLFSPDGTTIAVIVHQLGNTPTNDEFQRLPIERSILKFFDVATRREIRSIEVPGNVYSLSFSPDSKRLGGRIASPTATNRDNSYQLTVWDIASGRQVFVIDNKSLGRDDPRETSFGFARTEWTPDGKRLVIEGRGGAAFLLLDAETGKVVSTLAMPPRGLVGGLHMAATFSPDGRRIACEHVQRNGRSVVSVLDADSSKELLTLPVTPLNQRTRGALTDISGVARLVFTPDGRRLLRFETTPLPGETGPDGARSPSQTVVRVTTWDATPLPEPKQP
jgi:serine/threonine protein kinase/WD40 repeat protein